MHTTVEITLSASARDAMRSLLTDGLYYVWLYSMLSLPPVCAFVKWARK